MNCIFTLPILCTQNFVCLGSSPDSLHTTQVLNSRFGSEKLKMHFQWTIPKKGFLFLSLLRKIWSYEPFVKYYFLDFHNIFLMYFHFQFPFWVAFRVRLKLSSHRPLALVHVLWALPEKCTLLLIWHLPIHFADIKSTWKNHVTLALHTSFVSCVSSLKIPAPRHNSYYSQN